jgi:hypothetical protein
MFAAGLIFILYLKLIYWLPHDLGKIFLVIDPCVSVHSHSRSSIQTPNGPRVSEVCN